MESCKYERWKWASWSMNWGQARMFHHVFTGDRMCTGCLVRNSELQKGFSRLATVHNFTLWFSEGIWHQLNVSLISICVNCLTELNGSSIFHLFVYLLSNCFFHHGSSSHQVVIGSPFFCVIATISNSNNINMQTWNIGYLCMSICILIAVNNSIQIYIFWFRYKDFRNIISKG